MTILPTHIRLLESERMTDNSDGGGRRTSRVIPDGVAGNVFPKVSRVDSVYGRVNLRKIFPHINTATLDVYAGAHLIITDAPDNDRISVLAFSTRSDFDLRAAARDRIESYVIAGPESRAILYGRQLQGSQAILLYQREEEPLPEVGDVYAISNESGGVTIAQQFVRVQDVAHEVRTFTDTQGGDFRRRVITLKIGSPLRYEFAGLGSPSRFSADAASITGRLRTTTVADAARYYGIQPVVGAVAANSLELTVSSVFGAIVPTTQRESAISLASAAGATALIPSANSVFNAGSFPVGYNVTQTAIRLPTAVAPGQITLRVGYPGSFLGPVTADVDGSFPTVADGGSLGPFAATVDYDTGIVVVNHWAQAYVVFPQIELSYKPAVRVNQAAHTQDIPITLATRGTVYSVPLLPLPAPGTLIVDYRAQGKWYRLRDEGAGELVGGDAAYGTGTVDYVSGAATITLGALPDVGSSVLLSWGSPVHYEVMAAAPDAVFETTLLATPVKPSSVVLTWEDEGVARTATDNGAGVITGHASGSIVYQTGDLKVSLPKAVAGNVNVAYDRDTLPVTQSGFSFGEPIAPYMVRVTDVAMTLPDGQPYTNITLVDNGAGMLFMTGGESQVAGYRPLGAYLVPVGQSFGTVDYATGVVTVIASLPISKIRYWDNDARVWKAGASGTGTVSTAVAAFTALPVASPSNTVPQTAVVTLGGAGVGLSLTLAPPTPMALVPGSLLFKAFGKNHIDRNGLIYTDVSPVTGSGRMVGSVDYATRKITLTDYPDAATANFQIIAALGRKGDFTVDEVAFRTSGSPLRPASLYVQCPAEDGELLVGTADQSGVVTGGMAGTVEQTMGVVRLTFAKQVLPGSLRYSAVVLSNLPLDADILGLDPVRLPSDGRVPIFRPADVVVIHHTGVYSLGTPAAGATFNVGRDDLSALWLEDANRKKLPDSLYVADLPEGTVTMAADLSLTGFTTPITARHRIEEMGLLSDVQINGQISLTAPLIRDFPAGSFLSSALLYGDIQARATNLFDQQTWTGVWQSTVIGSGATAQYNDIDYPVEVLNNGAVTEAWRLNFTSPTSFQIIGENLGVIGVGSTSADVQPINALTGLPFFTLRAAGFGAGWSAGNQLRFNTISAAPPTWFVRTVLPGAALTGDSFDAQLRGDVD